MFGFLKQKSVLKWVLAISIFAIFTVTLDIRPGREWFILRVLLFQYSLVDLLIYLLVFALAVFTCLALLFSENVWVRIIAWIAFIPTIFINSCYRFITGYDFIYNDWLMASSNMNFAGNAFWEFFIPGFFGTMLTMFIVAVGGLLLWKKTFRASVKALWLVPLGIVLVYHEIGSTVGVVDQFPAMLRIPIILVHYQFNQLPVGERAEVKEKPVVKGLKQVFLLVDESITAGDLQFYGNADATTPFLVQNREKLIDFGKAVSYANYSAGSNISLTSGARMSELPDKNMLRKPSIYQYAKKAGYKTFLIDAQMADGQLQNFLTSYDTPFIDSIIQIAHLQKDRLRYEDRDGIIADVLKELSASKEPVFAYVVKHGAHWPYARTYSESEAVFTPALDRSSLLRDKKLTKNTYHNSIRWNVDEFWKKLIVNLEGKDSTLVLYTSDHGQDIVTEGIRVPHATVHDVSKSEAEVPLWLYANYPFPFKPGHKNDCHHEDIFPTLLVLFGYDPTFVHRQFGATLLDQNYKAEKNRTFLTGDIFGRAKYANNRFD